MENIKRTKKTKKREEYSPDDKLWQAEEDLRVAGCKLSAKKKT